METLSIERMEINEGSIVELAWYTGQPADVNPFEPHIRWHYPVEASAKPTIASQIRQAKPAPKQVAKPKPAAKPTYDLDLKGKRSPSSWGAGKTTSSLNGSSSVTTVSHGLWIALFPKSA